MGYHFDRSAKALKIRTEIVELCRQPRRLRQLSELTGYILPTIARHCRRLADDGYLEIMVEPNGINVYHTIRAEEYSDQKQAKNPNARVYRMEDFDKIPGYFR